MKIQSHESIRVNQPANGKKETCNRDDAWLSISTIFRLKVCHGCSIAQSVQLRYRFSSCLLLVVAAVVVVAVLVLLLCAWHFTWKMHYYFTYLHPFATFICDDSLTCTMNFGLASWQQQWQWVQNGKASDGRVAMMVGVAMTTTTTQRWRRWLKQLLLTVNEEKNARTHTHPILA